MYEFIFETFKERGAPIGRCYQVIAVDEVQARSQLTFLGLEAKLRSRTPITSKYITEWKK